MCMCMCACVCRNSHGMQKCLYLHMKVYKNIAGEGSKDIRGKFSEGWRIFAAARMNVIGKLQRELVFFPGGPSGKEPACQQRRHRRHEFDPWAWKVPWRRAWQPTPVFLPGESHGQRSLEGYSPQGCKDLNMTEANQYVQFTTIFLQKFFTWGDELIIWSGLSSIFMVSSLSQSYL